VRVIDMNTWKRREHFAFFSSTAHPVYNITFNLDVTKLRAFAKARGYSFNLSMVFLSTKALNAVENFRYRLRGQEVVLHDRLSPSFAEIEKGDDLFKMVTVEMEDELPAFLDKARQRAESQTAYFNVDDFKGRDDFVFYSTIPWISFTSVDHTVNLRREDAIQRVSFGKYFEAGVRILMPYNIQVNHLFVDGYHLGLLKDGLDGLVAECE
jgi:chloramphenicol O-acetyltransferase type A